jgi:hypothetical protein
VTPRIYTAIRAGRAVDIGADVARVALSEAVSAWRVWSLTRVLARAQATAPACRGCGGPAGPCPRCDRADPAALDAEELELVRPSPRDVTTSAQRAYRTCPRLYQPEAIGALYVEEARAGR